MKCSECCYYASIKPADEKPPGGGECRRRSPAVSFVPVPAPDLQSGGLKVKIERCSAFPTVMGDGWCGEFRPPETTSRH